MTDEQSGTEAGNNWGSEWHPIIAYSGSFTQFISVNDHIGLHVHVKDGACETVDIAYRDGDDWRMPDTVEEALHAASDMAVVLANQFSVFPVVPGTPVGMLRHAPPSGFDGISGPSLS